MKTANMEYKFCINCERKRVPDLLDEEYCHLFKEIKINR